MEKPHPTLSERARVHSVTHRISHAHAQARAHSHERRHVTMSQVLVLELRLHQVPLAVRHRELVGEDGAFVELELVLVLLPHAHTPIHVPVRHLRERCGDREEKRRGRKMRQKRMRKRFTNG